MDSDSVNDDDDDDVTLKKKDNIENQRKAL